MSRNCRETIELYKAVFGTLVNFMMIIGDAKMGSKDQKDQIIYAQFDISGYKFHLADNMNTQVVSGNQTSFTVVISYPEEVKASLAHVTAV